jgi:hypothetical protein
MFSIFTKASTPSKPVLVPLPPRKPFNTIFNEQWQSPFFSQLPAETRNVIYSYVFDSGPRELLSVEAHPLSMLLTCRKVYQEASILAFACHTFSISVPSHSAMSTSMRDATSHLSPYQIEAITALACDLGGNYVSSRFHLGPSSIILQAISLFPNLRRFEVRILRGRRGPNDNYHRYHFPYQDVRKEAVEKYAPPWFLNSIVEPVTRGCAIYWQPGERLHAEWPQFEDDTYYDVLETTNYEGSRCLALQMHVDAVVHVRGVTTCPCPCGSVGWTSVDVLQENGRRIAIDTVYYGPEDRPLPEIDAETALLAKWGPKAVILRPGAQPLASNEDLNLSGCFLVTGHGHDADEEYWESIRRRNGDWRALCRGAWKALTVGAPKENLLGSKALNQGDWAMLQETVRASGTGNEDKPQAVEEHEETGAWGLHNLV